MTSSRRLLVLASAIAIISVGLTAFQASAVYVNGYFRSNGTYVNGYERTAPDSNPYNNYSFPGNYNPNTGKITGGNPDTYLNNYYGQSSGGSYSPTYNSYDYSYPTTPSCPLNSYYDGISSCKCNYGYVIGASGQCVSGNSYCSSKLGLMSQYNSLSKQCECMIGYEFDGSSCTYKTTNYYYPPAYSTNSSNCPINSHASPTDLTKCQCDSGFQANLAKDGCTAVPTKTNDQACQDTYGSNSNWDGTKTSDGQLNCGCQSGYEWNQNKTSCVVEDLVLKTQLQSQIAALLLQIQQLQIKLNQH